MLDPIDQCNRSLGLVSLKSWFLIKMCTVWSMYFAVHMMEWIYLSGRSDLLSLIYFTTASGSSVVEHWAIYPEVAGSISAQTQLFKNFKLVGNGIAMHS